MKRIFATHFFRKTNKNRGNEREREREREREKERKRERKKEREKVFVPIKKNDIYTYTVKKNI